MQRHRMPAKYPPIQNLVGTLLAIRRIFNGREILPCGLGNQTSYVALLPLP